MEESVCYSYGSMSHFWVKYEVFWWLLCILHQRLTDMLRCVCVCVCVHLSLLSQSLYVQELEASGIGGGMSIPVVRGSPSPLFSSPLLLSHILSLLLSILLFPPLLYLSLPLLSSP